MAVTVAAVGSSRSRRAKQRVLAELATQERPREILPVIGLAATLVMAIAPAAIRVRPEIQAEPVLGEGVPVAAQIAIVAQTATLTGIIMEGTTGTPTLAIGCRPTRTRAFIRRAPIPITMTARPMRSVFRMACLPAKTMAGASKHTLRNARIFTVKQTEGIVPRKDPATLMNRLTAMVSFTVIVKDTNTSDHDAN